ncbi:MAG: NYN domain-containing protein [Candidatus Pacebacteria bacterium]|nr:NYN domain-containing protein [Candidatus Paceibacterota bacterium]
MARLSILIDSGYLVNSARKILSSAPSDDHRVVIDFDGLHSHLSELAARIAPKASLDRLRWYSGYSRKRGYTRKQQAVIDHCDYFADLLPNYEDGSQKGVDSAITADLIDMGLEESISDIILLSGDADYLPGLSKAKQYGRLRGLRVFVLGIERNDGEASVSVELMDQAYSIFWWDAAKLAEFITVIDPKPVQLSHESSEPTLPLPLESAKDLPPQPMIADNRGEGFTAETGVDDLALARQDLAGFDHPSPRHTTIDFDGDQSVAVLEPLTTATIAETPLDGLDHLPAEMVEVRDDSNDQVSNPIAPMVSPNRLPDTISLRGAIKAFVVTQSFRFAIADDGGTDVYISPRLVVDAELTNMTEGTRLILEVVKGQVITSVAAATEVEITLGSDPQSGVHFGTILPFERHHSSRKVLGDNGTEYWIGRRLLRDAKLSHLGEGSRLVFELGPSREAVAVRLDSDADSEVAESGEQRVSVIPDFLRQDIALSPTEPISEPHGADAELVVTENEYFVKALEYYRSSDFGLAEYHYRQAALQGHSEALKALGFMYHYGQGLRPSPFLAYLFAQLANRFAGEVPVWIPRSFMVGLDAEQIEFATEFANRWQIGMELPERE